MVNGTSVKELKKVLAEAKTTKNRFGNFRITPTIIKGKTSFVVMRGNFKFGEFNTIVKAVLQAQRLDRKERNVLELAIKAKRQALQATDFARRQTTKAKRSALAGLDFVLLTKKEKREFFEQRRKKRIQELNKTRKGKIILAFETFISEKPIVKRKKKKLKKSRKLSFRNW